MITNSRISMIVTVLAQLTSFCLPPVLAQEATVTVTAQTDSGNPIEDAPIEIGSDTDFGFGFTDQAGEVSFVIDVDTQSDSDILARLWHGKHHPSLTPNLTASERRMASERHKELVKTYHFKPIYFIQTTPGQQQYQLNIQANQAVQATGRLVNAEGAPVDDNIIWVFVRNSAWKGGSYSTNGEFAAYGVRKGFPAELFLPFAGPQTHNHMISAEETNSDVALGDIVVAPANRTVPLDMNVTDAEDLYDRTETALSEFVTLLRDDAQVLLTFLIEQSDGDSAGNVREFGGDVPRTTDGVYYIVPGPLGGQDALDLLDAIRDGQQAQLDAAGVPKLTAVEGETTMFTLDARAAIDAIRAMTGNAP